jgi:hypothetical protein
MRLQCQLLAQSGHKLMQRTCPLLAKAVMPKNAIDVAIGGKADIAFCGANVRF